MAPSEEVIESDDTSPLPLTTTNAIHDDGDIGKSNVAAVSDEDDHNNTTEKTSPYYHALSKTISNKHCILLSALIVLSHALFLWGQLDILWGQFVYTQVDVNASISVGGTNNKSASVNNEQSVEIGAWSYGGMLNELWVYSKLTAVFLFVFSAFWPHLKLALLHVYFYTPIPSKPRQSALYWLDAVGKMSLADVCATCMLFLLLNVQADINVSTLANTATQLLGEVVTSGNRTETLLTEGILSNTTQTLLDKTESWAYGEIVELSDSIFENDDPTVYKSFLEKGCSQFYNNGATCSDTPFYEPSNVKGGIAGIMTKCLRIRNDRCYQCECIVNNAIYNQAIPNEVVKSSVEKSMSLLLAKLLTTVKSGDIDFASWFDVGGNAFVGMYITIYPAFLGFTVAVILSIAASLVVTHIEEKDCMKRLRSAVSMREALKNGGVPEDQRSLLFCSDGSRKSNITRFLYICIGVGIIPLTFFSIYVKMFVYSIAGLLEELILMQVGATETLYSIIDCVVAVNDGSGYGKAFAVFYGIFLLGIPMLRATLLAVLSLIPMTPLWHVRIASTSNNVGSYIGWEPFFLCVFILMAELPSLTENTVNPETCREIEETNLMSSFINHFGLDDTSTCFVMYFNMLPAITLFILAWLVLTGVNALAWKKILLRYDPFGTRHEIGDEGGPYCSCRQCCYFGCVKIQCKEGTCDEQVMKMKEDDKMIESDS